MRLIYYLIIILLILFFSCDVFNKVDSSEWKESDNDEDDTYIIYVVGSSNNGTDTDFLILKYDSTGKLYRSKTFDGGNDDVAYGVVGDSRGNIYVTGSMNTGTNMNEYLTIKYNRYGDMEWQKIYGTSGQDVATGITVDNNDYIYVTGYSLVGGNYVYHTIKYDQYGNVVASVDTDKSATADYGSAIVIDKNRGYAYLTGYANYTSYEYQTVKYNLDLIEITGEAWPRFYPDPSDGDIDEAYGITVDNSGNIYVTGSNDNWSMYCTIKYDIYGNLITTEAWPKIYDGPGNDYPNGIVVDSNNNIYVTGYSSIGGDNDFYTIKYDSYGNELWNDTYDNGADDQAFAVTVDQHGDVYVAGASQNASNMDFLIIKYDPNGNIIWTARYDSGDEDGAQAIYIVKKQMKNF